MKLTVTFEKKNVFFSCIVIDSSKLFLNCLDSEHSITSTTVEKENTVHIAFGACNVVDVNTAFQKTFSFFFFL